MLGRIVTSALFAGFAAGLIAALLQLALVQPVLLEAEQFETGARTLVETGTQDPAGPAVHEHGHDH